MSILIVPLSLSAAAVVSPVMRLVFRDERNRANRARFLWWVFELTVATLSAMMYWFDAIYRVLFSDYRLYTPGTLLGISFYFLLIVGALCRVVLPQNIIEFVLYPEKLWVYYRLRYLCKDLHKLVNLPEVYRYQAFFWPSLHNLDREISRSVVSICDVSRLLDEQHGPIFRKLTFLRNPHFNN
ncbi:MAG: hypothetical protein Q9P01_09310 [Anaerolineae bacterium]|nr:hypothetical protein [Anaerolineae bacterium]